MLWQAEHCNDIKTDPTGVSASGLKSDTSQMLSGRGDVFWVFFFM